MKSCKQPGLWATALFVIVFSLCNASAESASEPMMLDLAPFFRERFVTTEKTNMEMFSVSGRQMFDGLPFNVDGRGNLYGKALAHQRNKPASAFPDFIGIKVERAFDELHVLHASYFTDREQEVIAKVRLHYADGTAHDFPIAYGAHVRDWQRMQSEEKEIYTDPETKVVWRGPGVRIYNSTTRLAKTRWLNPFPDKVVKSIDFLSTGNVASYDVVAATVAKADPNRPVTPPVPLDRPERRFDALITVRVVDENNRPIRNVLVTPNIKAGGSLAATVTTPLYTSADGSGVVKYPKNESAAIYFTANKTGWRRLSDDAWIWFNRPGTATNGLVAVIQMKRDGTPITDEDDNPAPSATTSTTTLATASPSVIIDPANASGFPGVPGAEPGAGILGIRFADRQPLLLIDYPVGTKVRIEYKCELNAPAWLPLTVISNLPSSPYPYICNQDPGSMPQCFYRAVAVPE